MSLSTYIRTVVDIVSGCGDESTEGEVTASGGVGSQPAEAEGATPSSAISPSVNSEESGVMPSSPLAPDTDDGGGTPASLTGAPSVIKTADQAISELAKREVLVGDLAVTGTGLAESEPVRRASRSASLGKRKKEKAPKGDGRCEAYAPFGTKCKLCGKVHPA